MTNRALFYAFARALRAAADVLDDEAAADARKPAASRTPDRPARDVPDDVRDQARRTIRLLGLAKNG